MTCWTCLTCDVSYVMCDTNHASSCKIVRAVGAGIQVQSHAMPKVERCMIMYTISIDMNFKDTFGKEYVFKIAAGVSRFIFVTTPRNCISAFI